MKELFDNLMENSFDKLWKDIAEEEIKKAIDASKNNLKTRENKHDVHERYKKNNEGIGNSKHEVAALFYSAFTEDANGHYFFRTSHDKIKEAIPFITHKVAFNIACGILMKDENDKNLKNYVNDAKDAEEFEQFLKRLIEAQHEKKLSIYNLVSFFAELENNLRNSYKVATLKKVLAGQNKPNP